MGKVLLALAVLLLSVGCVSYHGAARIESQPSGAQVVDLEEDTVLGITPIDVWWRDAEEQRKFINIRVQRRGYRDKTTSFWLNLRHRSKRSALADPALISIKLEKGK